MGENTVQLQNGHEDDSGNGNGGTEPQPTQAPSSESAAAPPTHVPDNVWDYTVPVPGSKNNKLIYLKAPFQWGQWTPEQWHERFVFVTKELQALVYKYLRLLDFESRPVYSPRMVGTCPSDARPSIVVTCREVDFRNIRSLFHSRAEEPLCLGNPSTLSQLRSRLGQRPAKRETTIPRLLLVYYQTRTPPVIRHALDEPLLAYLGDGGMSCGGLARYGQRSATLGITLAIGNFRGVLTVDHLFSAKTTDKPSSPVAGASVLLDRPSTPVSMDFDQTSPDSLWEDDDEYGDLGPDDPRALNCSQGPTEAPGPAAVLGTQMASLDPEEWYKLASSAQAAQLTPSAAYLDWALTWPVPDRSSISPSCINTVFPGGQGSPAVVLEALEAKPSAHLAPVYIVSGIRGILHGQIISTPSFLPSSPGGESCEAWTVLLDAPYRKTHASPQLQFHTRFESVI
jgi:hypothetical protein